MRQLYPRVTQTWPRLSTLPSGGHGFVMVKPQAQGTLQGKEAGEGLLSFSADRWLPFASVAEMEPGKWSL